MILVHIIGFVSYVILIIILTLSFYHVISIKISFKDIYLFTHIKKHNAIINHTEYAIFIIRPTCWDVLWYGAGVCLSVCPSVCLSIKLVNTIQIEPFQLGPSNLVHLLLMTRGQTLLIFKVRGQRSRSHAIHCC